MRVAVIDIESRGLTLVSDEVTMHYRALLPTHMEHVLRGNSLTRVDIIRMPRDPGESLDELFPATTVTTIRRCLASSGGVVAFINAEQ